MYVCEQVGVRARPKPAPVAPDALSAAAPPSDAVRMHYARVRSAVEEQAKVAGEYDITSFVTQLRAPAVHFLAVAYSETNAVVHVRLQVPAANDADGDVVLEGVRTDLKAKDALVYFDKQ